MYGNNTINNVTMNFSVTQSSAYASPANIVQSETQFSQVRSREALIGALMLLLKLPTTPTIASAPAASLPPPAKAADPLTFSGRLSDDPYLQGSFNWKNGKPPADGDGVRQHVMGTPEDGTNTLLYKSSNLSLVANMTHYEKGLPFSKTATVVQEYAINWMGQKLTVNENGEVLKENGKKFEKGIWDLGGGASINVKDGQAIFDSPNARFSMETSQPGRQRYLDMSFSVTDDALGKPPGGVFGALLKGEREGKTVAGIDPRAAAFDTKDFHAATYDEERPPQIPLGNSAIPSRSEGAQKVQPLAADPFREVAEWIVGLARQARAGSGPLNNVPQPVLAGAFNLQNPYAYNAAFSDPMTNIGIASLTTNLILSSSYIQYSESRILRASRSGPSPPLDRFAFNQFGIA